MLEQRKFPRVNVQLKLAFEFVRWNDHTLDQLVKPIYTTSCDISVRGVGISSLPDINSGLIKQLERGEKKIKLAIYLYENAPPILIFARLVWGDYDRSGNKDNSDKEYGFLFLDIIDPVFRELNRFINDQLAPFAVEKK